MFDEARPALERLRRTGTPVVLCTSKTRAEVVVLREALDNRHPFIVENGGAIYIPGGYFPFDITGAERRYGLTVIPFGAPYEELVRALARASQATGVRVRGFSDMDASAVATATGLTLGEAQLACDREFDEPFEILDGTGAAQLLAAIEHAGYDWTTGGRFHHIIRGNDKASAVRRLVGLYRQHEPTITTIGLGDAPNDAEFLHAVDVPIIVASSLTAEMTARVPHARVTRLPGPAGWNEALMELLDAGA